MPLVCSPDLKQIAAICMRSAVGGIGENGPLCVTASASAAAVPKNDFMMPSLFLIEGFKLSLNGIAR